MVSPRDNTNNNKKKNIKDFIFPVDISITILSITIGLPIHYFTPLRGSEIVIQKELFTVIVLVYFLMNLFILDGWYKRCGGEDRLQLVAATSGLSALLFVFFTSPIFTLAEIRYEYGIKTPNMSDVPELYAVVAALGATTLILLPLVSFLLYTASGSVGVIEIDGDFPDQILGQIKFNIARLGLGVGNTILFIRIAENII